MLSNPLPKRCLSLSTISHQQGTERLPGILCCEPLKTFSMFARGQGVGDPFLGIDRVSPAWQFDVGTVSVWRGSWRTLTYLFLTRPLWRVSITDMQKLQCWNIGEFEQRPDMVSVVSDSDSLEPSWGFLAFKKKCQSLKDGWFVRLSCTCWQRGWPATRSLLAGTVLFSPWELVDCVVWMLRSRI